MEKLPAIIIVSYNRPGCLIRLLQSIENADYHNYGKINLVISIDGGGVPDMEAIAKDFQWIHGRKKLIQHKENMGLRNHILSCGELTNDYDSIIILEDDCFVSRNFYDYTCQALSFYQGHANIAGVSLCAYQTNENIGLPFIPLAEGFDAYFMQVPSSWGQVWTTGNWQSFKKWMGHNQRITDQDLLPDNVKVWPETSWKKYFYKYMVDEDLFFVYPSTSLVTNFGDKGTHYSYPVPYFQVPLETRLANKNYSFITFNESYNKYDAYFELLPDSFQRLGITLQPNTGIDLYGTKQPGLFDYDYLFSIRDCSAPLQSFGVVMFPLVQNILNNIGGETIHYAKAEAFLEDRQEAVSSITRNYQLLGYTLGVAEGRKKATGEIMLSRSYRIGNAIIRPFHWLNQLFKKRKN